MHDPDYRTSQKDFNSFAECLQEKIVVLDETVPELPIKDVVSHTVTIAILWSAKWIVLNISYRYFESTEMSDLVPIRLLTKSVICLPNTSSGSC